MSHRFTDLQRWAVFETHKDYCWLCGERLPFNVMAVDHVIPEALVLTDRKDELAKVLSDFGLTTDFNINSYENWLPAHLHCNNKKRDHIFRPTPLIQFFLDRAMNKASQAAEAEARLQHDKKMDKIIAKLGASLSIPTGELYALAQRYATANATVEVIGTEIITPSSGIGFAYTRSIEGYVPPPSVVIGPSLTIVFDQTPVANSQGPFTFKTESTSVE